MATTLQFLGAARSVTGSCFLVQHDGRQVLVDCGLVQGATEQVERNWLPFPFDPREVDAVLLTHAHLDHSGLVPRLVAEGFQGRILTTAVTKDLLPVLWEDYVRLQGGDTQGPVRPRPRQSLGQRPRGKPTVRQARLLYSGKDVDQTLALCEAHPYGAKFTVAPGLDLRLTDAGHILGSAIIELWAGDLKLVFSGDLGHRGKPIVRDPSPVEEAQVLVLESTYGDRNHKNMADTTAELGQVLTETLSAGGTVLMPVYAIGRSQDILYMINQLSLQGALDRPRVFLDSPMAIRAAGVYGRHLEAFDEEATRLIRHPPKNPRAPRVRFTETGAASRGLARLRGVVILAGSGMCEGGRITDHLTRHLGDSRCCVVITGFQAEGTLGRQLVDGATSVRIRGKMIPVKARIHTINGLSAHADQAGLLDWVQAFRNPKPRTFLVHGEPEKMLILAAALARRHGISARMPGWRESVVLTGSPRPTHPKGHGQAAPRKAVKATKPV